MNSTTQAENNVFSGLCKTHTGKKVLVRVQGGREFLGTLISYDAFSNMILDDAIEYIKEKDDSSHNIECDNITELRPSRPLGVVFVRGHPTNVITSAESLRPIPNPYKQEQL